MQANCRRTSLRLHLTRRDWIRSGAAAFGLPQLVGSHCEATEFAPTRRAKSIILIYLPGGLAQHESFDLKPDAPDGIRGEFKPIATDVPGIDICEHLPFLARRSRQFALVRSMSHEENNHFPATHKALTGHVMPRQLPGDASNAGFDHRFPDGPKPQRTETVGERFAADCPEMADRAFVAVDFGGGRPVRIAVTLGVFPSETAGRVR